MKNFHNSFVLTRDCSNELYPSFDNLNEQLYVDDHKDNTISFLSLHSKTKYEIGDYICNIKNDYYPTKIRDPFVDTERFINIFKNTTSDLEFETQLQKQFNMYYNHFGENVNVVCAKDPILFQTCYKATKVINPGDELLRYKGFVYGLKQIASTGLLTNMNITGFIRFIQNNTESLTLDFSDKEYIYKLLETKHNTTNNPIDIDYHNDTTSVKIYLKEIEDEELAVIFKDC